MERIQKFDGILSFEVISNRGAKSIAATLKYVAPALKKKMSSGVEMCSKRNYPFFGYACEHSE